MTIAAALEQGRRRLADTSDTADNDAQVLLARCLGKDKAWLLAHPEKTLDPIEIERWEAVLGTCEAGVPLPYVIGEWEFFGLPMKVTPAVLIPRPETEMLVEAALHWLRAHPGRRRALDVGTGSGCIPVALAEALPDLHAVASDVSPEALEVARANVARFHLAARVRLVETHLMQGITGSFDLICANLPYIPDDRVPGLAVSRWEPRVALGGGPDGLRFIEPFLEPAAARLASPGLVLAEIDASLEGAVQRIAGARWPHAHIEVRKDLAGLPRLLVVDTE